VAGALIVLAGWLFSEQPFSAAILVPALLFILVTALAETLGALNWVHWNHARDKVAAAAAAAAIIVATCVGGLLLASSLRLNLFPGGRSLLIAASLAVIAGLYFLVRVSHERWRASDIEYARRLLSSSRWDMIGARLFERRLGRVVAAELVRDLQLTLRAFSSAVYVVAGLASLWPVGLIAVLTTDLLPPPFESRGWFDATWLPAVFAVKGASILITSTLASLLAVLIAYELPHMWLERAVGTTGLDIWQAKLWYARLVSVPAPLISWLVGFALGAVPAYYAVPLLAECLFIWWLVSSLIGSLSFEMPNRPGLSIIVMVTIGGGAGALVAMLWPFGFMLYAQAMHSLTQRGRHRTRYYLLTEGD
jgi:hypothetical protein